MFIYVYSYGTFLQIAKSAELLGLLRGEGVVWCLIADVAGRFRGGCCSGCCWQCRWWCLIANVVEGVNYRVSIVSRLVLGLSLVVFVWVGGVCYWWCLLAGVAGGCRGGCCVGVAGGVRSWIWVGGVVLGGGLACF